MPTRREISLLTAVLGLVVTAAALAPSLPTLFVAIALVGGVSMWLIARANAFVLLSAHAPYRARMMGLWTMALPGMNVVSGLLVGSGAQLVGPRASYAGVGVIAIVVGGVIWRRARPRPR